MWVDVALPVPVPHTFTYATDEALAVPGVRVRVPFGKRHLVGWIVGEASSARVPERVRSIERVLDEEPSITPDLLKLCRWIAGYYATPLGVVLRAALPAVLSDHSRTSSPVKTQRVLRVTADLTSLLERDEVFGRARRQRECFELIESLGGSASVRWLAEQAGFSAAIVTGLVARGIAGIIEEPVLRDPFADLAPQPVPGHQLTHDQTSAVARLVDAAKRPRDSGLSPFLLLGVTGSGKTQVYIELLRQVVLERGRGAIVLVPEISLTPQTVARFRAHFGDRIAVLHSALSDGERYDAWRALHRGDRTIAIGARSAVFAPVRDLGAIIVDEEHEASYKQSEAPRYNAREVAVVRAGMADAVCVLGSATPSLETWHNTESGRYQRIELPVRVGGLPLPPVQIIDLRKERTREKGRRSSLSAELAGAVDDRIARGEQCILLLNRRGFSTFVQCSDCGNVWHCPDCSVALTYHRARRRLVCHYCFREQPRPTTCEQCGSDDVAFLGMGTEQVERDVAERFPTARIARMDVDTTSAKWSHHDILSRVENREIDILLGTQMIAKGLDFPNVTLVGVINADIGMNLPDFRASERTFQLLTQVAGRAGRGPLGGTVFIQTAMPGHYAIRCAIEHDYRAFAEREIAEREPPGYPPHSRLANVVVSGTSQDAVIEAAGSAARWLRDEASRNGLDDVLLTGPAPCPIDRIRGRWRWHFLLRSARPRSLGAACRMIQYGFEPASGRGDLRLILDRDPVTLL